MSWDQRWATIAPMCEVGGSLATFDVWNRPRSLCANIFLMTIELTDVGCWGFITCHGPVIVWVSGFILTESNFKSLAPGILSDRYYEDRNCLKVLFEATLEAVCTSVLISYLRMCRML